MEMVGGAKALTSGCSNVGAERPRPCVVPVGIIRCFVARELKCFIMVGAIPIDILKKLMKQRVLVPKISDEARNLLMDRHEEREARDGDEESSDD
jgi:hypothetical protein